MPTSAAAPNSFQLAYATFVQYAGPALQMLYWLVLIVVAIWAVLLFKRLVDYRTGRSVAPKAAAVAEGAEEPVKVEEFVD